MIAERRVFVWKVNIELQNWFLNYSSAPHQCLMFPFRLLRFWRCDRFCVELTSSLLAELRTYSKHRRWLHTGLMLCLNASGTWSRSHRSQSVHRQVFEGLEHAILKAFTRVFATPSIVYCKHHVQHWTLTSRVRTIRWVLRVRWREELGNLERLRRGKEEISAELLSVALCLSFQKLADHFELHTEIDFARVERSSSNFLLTK